jgi:hypothetical protein
MDVQTIAMEAEDAAQALRAYRQALKERPVQTRDEAERELAAIDAAVMRGYRALARGGRLVELSKVLAAGGTMDVEWVWRSWGANPRVEQRITTMPKLAVCRADSRFVSCRGIDANGVVAFHAGGSQRKADTVESRPTFDVPPDEQRRRWEAFRTMLPTIPPQLRPPKRLGLYHVLWEVESWELATPPGDPALLKHLGGDLYALLAVWDLTELERAVLAGVRG